MAILKYNQVSAPNLAASIAGIGDAYKFFDAAGDSLRGIGNSILANRTNYADRELALAASKYTDPVEFQKALNSGTLFTDDFIRRNASLKAIDDLSTKWDNTFKNASNTFAYDSSLEKYNAAKNALAFSDLVYSSPFSSPRDALNDKGVIGSAYANLTPLERAYANQYLNLTQGMMTPGATIAPGYYLDKDGNMYPSPVTKEQFEGKTPITTESSKPSTTSDAPASFTDNPNPTKDFINPSVVTQDIKNYLTTAEESKNPLNWIKPESEFKYYDDPLYLLKNNKESKEIKNAIDYILNDPNAVIPSGFTEEEREDLKNTEFVDPFVYGALNRKQAEARNKIRKQHPNYANYLIRRAAGAGFTDGTVSKEALMENGFTEEDANILMNKVAQSNSAKNTNDLTASIKDIRQEFAEPAASQPKPADTTGFNPGFGSMTYKSESNGNPVAIGYDKVGGTSYGGYQISARNMPKFVEFLKTQGPDAQLAAKQFKGITNYNTGSRTGAAVDAFNKAANFLGKDKFMQLQHDWIVQSHFNPTMNRITMNNPALAALINSVPTLKEVVFSMAVNMGEQKNSGASFMLLKAFDNANGDPLRFVQELNNLRSNTSSTHKNSTKSVQQAVKNRVSEEGRLLEQAFRSA